MKATTQEPTTVLAPAMPLGSVPIWSDAVWVGEIQDRELPTGRVHLQDVDGFATARLLVRHGRSPRGFVHLPVDDGTLDADQLRAAVAELPEWTRLARAAQRPPISVVICTLDRPTHLQGALASVLQLDYPEFEIVVVDNNPASGLTRRVVEACDRPGIRVVDAPIRGLARARNIGLVSALHSIVAFTDDDVVVDRWWLQGIADGFGTANGVACVCGIVPSGELVSLSQAYFDRRVQWARSCRPEVFSLAEGPPNEPLFPFQVGRFGTGANFAIRREVALALEGFDEALGIGSPTGGGEDIDMFVRVLLAGHRLTYEPDALVWHRHRADLASLSRQIRDYGTGLGAWLAKLALNPSTALMMLRRGAPGLRHVWRITRVDMATEAITVEVAGLGRIERAAIIKGPLALLKARRSGARSHPLRRQRAATDGGPKVNEYADAEVTL